MAAICQVGSWIFQSQNFQLQTRSRGHNAKFMAIYLFFQQGGHLLSWIFWMLIGTPWWLSSRVVDSGAEGPGFKSQLRHCWVTVLGKPFTSTVPLFTKQQN